MAVIGGHAGTKKRPQLGPRNAPMCLVNRRGAEELAIGMVSEDLLALHCWFCFNRLYPSSKSGCRKGGLSTGRGRVQRKWAQPENIMFAQSLGCSRTSGKIRPNLSNSAAVKTVKIRQSGQISRCQYPAISGKIRQNPAKSG